jgi:hypothetical protein
MVLTTFGCDDFICGSSEGKNRHPFQGTNPRRRLQLPRTVLDGGVMIFESAASRIRSIPSRGERIFPVASVFRPALGPTQPPVQWVPGSFPRG